MVLHTLQQELIDYISRWIFKNVTSKQTSFVTNINTVRCSRNDVSSKAKTSQLLQSLKNKGTGRACQQRVLDVKMGNFTSLVFGTNHGMGAEC